MRKRLVDEIIASIDGIVDDQTLQTIRKNVSICMEKYEITERETALVPVDYMPDSLKTYLVTRKIEGLSPLTIKNYASRLKNFFDTVGLPIEKICSNDIKVYLYRYQEQTGISNRTLNSVATIIRTFFRWATAEDYIAKDQTLTIKNIKFEKKDRGFLTDMELENLRNACESLRDHAIIELSYSTGCRVSELVNLKRSDIDFENGTVTLFGKGSKYRKSYLNAKAIYALKKYFLSRSDQNEYAIVKDRKPYTQITRSMVQKRIEYLGEKAGIQKRITPHILRHTTATLGLQHGMDITEIQKMLGHVNIGTTLVYASVSNNSVQQAHTRCIV